MQLTKPIGRMSPMLARDYDALGTEKSILQRIGDGRGYPFRGPIKIRFIDANTLAVIEISKGISFLSIDSSDNVVLGNGTKIEDTNDLDAILFLKVAASDVCRVPLSKDIAVCDTISKSLNFINSKEWFQHKRMPTNMVNLVAISCFQMGYEAYFSIYDGDEKSLAICKEGGQVVASCVGDPSNVFDSVVSVSMFDGDAQLSKSIPVPSWYMGVCTAEVLFNALDDESEPGSFVVAKDANIKTPVTFNVVYIDSLWRKNTATIAKNTTGEYLLASKDATLLQISVWEVIKKWDMVIKVDPDPRRYLLFALADPGTKCVQILKYYWWKNDLYEPCLEYFTTIGGVYRGCGLRLIRPSSVSYVAGVDGGDLAICDTGLHKVFIVSKRLILVHAIETSFAPDWHIFSEPEIGLNVPPDVFPESVAFNVNRMLCVGYRGGGILVYKPYHIAQVGNFVDFERNIFDNILNYADYPSIELLRNSCRRFHNITRDMRREWTLPIMSQKRYKDVLYQFIKWARVDSGLPFMPILGILKDNEENQLCVDNLNKNCTNRFCTLSHKPLEVNLKYIAKKGASFLLYDQLQIVFTEVYGTRFMWKNGIFISEYFEHYSEMRPFTTRKDPMSWKNETLRTEIIQETKVLTFWPYLKLMTMAEECFTQCKSFDLQPTFCVHTRPSLAVPRGQLRGINDAVFYEERGQPYLKKIANIPSVKNKVPHLKAITGLSEVQQRETSLPEGKAHVTYFEHQTDRVVSLMDKLFS